MNQHTLELERSLRHGRRLGVLQERVQVEQLGNGETVVAQKTVEEFVEFLCGRWKWEQLGHLTIDQVVLDPSDDRTMYCGSSLQTQWEVDARNFMQRGIGKTTDTGNLIPPFSMPGGKYFDSVAELKKIGFFSFMICQCGSMNTVKRIEELIQLRYDHLDYPTKIMYKQAGAGANYVGVYDDPNCCVYVSFIPYICAKLEEDNPMIIVTDLEKSKDHYCRSGSSNEK